MMKKLCMKHIRVKKISLNHFIFIQLRMNWFIVKGNAVAQFFIWAFLGFIFFIGAASVLYFRMYNDLTNEKQNILRLQSSD